DAWVTLEVSSFQLESVRAFHPKIAAVLNIKEDHLNRHYTMDNYIAVKERIFANQGPGDTLILNYDDPRCRDMSLKTQGDTAWFSASGRVGGKGHTVYLDGGTVWYEYKSYTVKLWEQREMRIPFLHILEDSMAAALAAIIAGAPVGLAAKVVKGFEGVPHRAEYVGRIDGADYYNDSKATNVDSAVKALEAAKGRVILIGGGQDKKADFTPWVRLFADKAAHVLLFGETAAQIADACQKTGFSRFKKVRSLKEAVDAARELAEAGDTVLLSPACASLDMFKDYEERGELFKEYVTARAEGREPRTERNT
ncbi:MAG: UDP-N-acetylmuramoyl-L-alanine--D-glutamate ligase, partial [Clostridiales bacterium]|nr:UDP-N-acetylmuramoyl-L-alanine--D-glutamate ligase [Clostridiales bacterium]